MRNVDLLNLWVKFWYVLKFRAYVAQKPNFYFILLADFLRFSWLRIFFSSTHLEILSFKRSIHFLPSLYTFFRGGLQTLNQTWTLNNKTHFLFWHLISHEPKNVGGKSKWMLKDATLTYDHHNLRTRTFDLVKNAKKRPAKGTWNMWNTLSE